VLKSALCLFLERAGKGVNEKIFVSEPIKYRIYFHLASSAQNTSAPAGDPAPVTHRVRSAISMVAC
jgi:hypothetical protein